MSQSISLSTILSSAQNTINTFQSQNGVEQGENNLVIGGDNDTSVTNISNNSKFFLGEGKNTCISKGDNIEYGGGDENDDVVFQGNNLLVELGNGKNQCYLEGGNANINSGNGTDYFALSGNNIKLDAGAGKDDINSGKLNIIFNRGSFSLGLSNTMKKIEDQDILYAFEDDVPLL